MAYLDHVERCNRRDMSRFRPFHAAGQRLGWVRHDIAEALAGVHPALRVTADAVTLAPADDTPEGRTTALAEVAAHLVAGGVLPRLRGEMYSVRTAWAAPEAMRIDRAAVTAFGLKAFGVHLNGYVRKADGSLHLWIGRRAPDKAVAPNKLDNLVAGGQPAGLSLRDNLYKEAAEEADIPAALAARAVAVGAITYCFENATGLKPDTMFCYDLALPEDFVPVNTDGELTGFELWPVEKVLAVVRDSEEFKFNVNLVILDFALRHGVLTPDEEPSYEALLLGLRQPHP